MGSGKLQDLPNFTMADIALHYPQAISILNRYELEYCCHGDRSFEQACTKSNLDPVKIWEDICAELPIPGLSTMRDFSAWDSAVLIDFIVQNHHEFVRVSIPKIKRLLSEVTDFYSGEFPQLSEIQTYFEMLSEDLVAHMPEEEEILFPAIKRVITRQVIAQKSPLITNIKSSVSFMEGEHESAMRFLKQIRHLSKRYTFPCNGSPTLEQVLRLLKDFDEDLSHHIHLENNVLFPLVK